MNMSKIMKMMGNIKALRSKSKTLSKQLKNKKFTTSSHDDLVTVTMTGDKKLVDLKIAQKVIDAKDADMLSDLIIATMNKNVDKINKYSQKAIKTQLGGMMK